jgi:hypothetical protein
LVAAGAALEALLWTAVPPAEETFGFAEDAIEKELGWLNAPSGPQKTLSFVLLALFPVAVFAGLWRRSWRLLAASAALIAIFYLLMLSVAAKSWRTRRVRGARILAPANFSEPPRRQVPRNIFRAVGRTGLPAGPAARAFMRGT